MRGNDDIPVMHAASENESCELCQCTQVKWHSFAFCLRTYNEFFLLSVYILNDVRFVYTVAELTWHACLCILTKSKKWKTECTNNPNETGCAENEIVSKCFGIVCECTKQLSKTLVRLNWATTPKRISTVSGSFHLLRLLLNAYYTFYSTPHNVPLANAGAKEKIIRKIMWAGNHPSRVCVQQVNTSIWYDCVLLYFRHVSSSRPLSWLFLSHHTHTKIFCCDNECVHICDHFFMMFFCFVFAFSLVA